MNFFYRWCARITKEHHEAINKQIAEKTRELRIAKHFCKVTDEARNAAIKYGKTPTELTKSEIESLVSFVQLKGYGANSQWENAVTELEKWFKEQGLDAP